MHLLYKDSEAGSYVLPSDVAGNIAAHEVISHGDERRCVTTEDCGVRGEKGSGVEAEGFLRVLRVADGCEVIIEVAVGCR